MLPDDTAPIKRKSGDEENSRGEMLMAMRIANGETMLQCGDKVGYTTQTIANWERERTPVNDRIWKRILKDYGMTHKAADDLATEYFKCNPRGVSPRNFEKFIGHRILEWVIHPMGKCIGFDKGAGDAIMVDACEMEIKTLRGMEIEFKFSPSNQITREHLNLLIAALEKHVIDDAPQNMEIPKTETAVPDAELV